MEREKSGENDKEAGLDVPAWLEELRLVNERLANERKVQFDNAAQQIVAQAKATCEKIANLEEANTHLVELNKTIVSTLKTTKDELASLKIEKAECDATITSLLKELELMKKEKELYATSSSSSPHSTQDTNPSTACSTSSDVSSLSESIVDQEGEPSAKRRKLAEELEERADCTSPAEQAGQQAEGGHDGVVQSEEDTPSKELQ